MKRVDKADPLQDNERSSDRPVPRQGEQRRGGHLHDVAYDGDGPEPASPISQPSRHQAQSIAEQFSESRHDSDNEGICVKRREKRPHDAARAFIGEVSKEAENTDQDNESQGGRSTASGFGPGRVAF